MRAAREREARALRESTHNLAHEQFQPGGGAGTGGAVSGVSAGFQGNLEGASAVGAWASHATATHPDVVSERRASPATATATDEVSESRAAAGMAEPAVEGHPASNKPDVTSNKSDVAAGTSTAEAGYEPPPRLVTEGHPASSKNQSHVQMSPAPTLAFGITGLPRS